MKKTFIIPAVLILTALFQFAVSGQTKQTSQFIENQWIGEYEYTENGSKNARGDNLLAFFSIKVFKRGGKLMAHYSSDGFQSGDDFLCTAKIGGNQIMLYFLKNNSDTPVFREGEEVNQKGYLTGILVKSVRNGKTKYIFKYNANDKYATALRKVK